MTDRPQATENDYSLSRQQVGWYLFSRLLTVTLLLAATIFYQSQSHRSESSGSLLWLFFLVAASYGQNLVSILWSRRLEQFRIFIQCQLLWDLVFATVFIYLTGGFASPFAFLFILLILSAAVFFSRRESLIVASASAILYGSLLDLQYYGYIKIRTLYGFVIRPDGYELLYTLFANVLAFFLTAILGGVIAERLRRSEKALTRREIDYRELESLNRAVVANIDSGVMTINRQGRIRLFNQGAERITGLTLATVYDQDVRQLFAGLNLDVAGGKPTTRGEGDLAHADGTLRTIGFTTSRIAGDRGGEGVLVVFQDLSRLKEMEGQLRRNERLAAVGRLAAGLAHEIRNPLASISGSVQLLLEGEKVGDEERRLMQIMVRETDRLNLLLSDFLRFARPAPPQMATTDLQRLLDEVVEQVGADPRFSGVVIHRSAGGPVTVECDGDQMKQALLNLLINATDAISGQGEIWLESFPAAGKIAIEDNGPGIPADLVDRIFDPFFTTKEGGTGLGLATVHAIIAAHQGDIAVESGRRGGARFVITLPVGR